MAGNEPISDIQNYLQTFNKEIGEEANPQGQTYYAIDTSQVTDPEPISIFTLIFPHSASEAPLTVTHCD